MDAKSKAAFINSVAAGDQKPCPKCNQLNSASAKFCRFCGQKLEENAQAAPEPVKVPEPAAAPEPVKVPEPAAAPEPVKVPEPAAAPEPVQTPSSAPVFETVEERNEPVSVFAEGLPDWNIEPPQIMVRRKRAK